MHDMRIIGDRLYKVGSEPAVRAYPMHIFDSEIDCRYAIGRIECLLEQPETSLATATFLAPLHQRLLLELNDLLVKQNPKK
jgi:hypothetical protein